GLAIVAVQEVHGRDLGVHQVGADREVALLGPLLGGEQDGGCAVGQRGGVTGGHGGGGAVLCRVALAEDRLELGQRRRGGGGAKVGVGRHAEVRGDEVLEEALVISLGQVLVGGRGELVLLLAGEVHLAGGDRSVVTHGQAGARLAVARLIRCQLGRAD